MSKTPTKSLDQSNCFIPKGITTPNKDSPGISKTVYTHITNLHHILNDWWSLKDKGTKICKSLSALKLYECEDDYYPHQTKSLVDGLLETLNGFENIVEGVNIINNQMHALSKLHNTNEPVINTWSVSEIANNIKNIYDILQKDFTLKKIITENIAHCRDENLIEVYISGWEFDVYLISELSSYLFAEVGLSSILYKI